MRDVISFLTDYGLEDGFVAACHGVIATIAPRVRVIDVSHLVPPQDVDRGAVVLAQTVAYLPDAVHLAVVDPGVGTPRRGVVLATPGSLFVGPDNGLLLPAAERVGGVQRAFELSNDRLWRHPVSRTFHGRDVFAPVAAHLAAGVPVDDVGPEVPLTSLVRVSRPATQAEAGRLATHVLTVDRFGNVQLAATVADLSRVGVRLGRDVVVHAGSGRHRARFVETFGAVPAGELLAYEDSAGLVAIAVNEGDAATRLGVRAGSELSLAPG